MTCTLLLALCALTPGDHVEKTEVGGRTRSFRVHVPPQFDAAKPTPVVLAFHGAGMDAERMAVYTGLDATADKHGFLVVYPDGTGVVRAFNAGGVRSFSLRGTPDDVEFVKSLLDTLETRATVDRRRVFACGLSNGGMFCHRLAAELSDRVAAIASVAGPLAVDDPQPTRPVPVLYFHGTADRVVPMGGPDKRLPSFVTFHSVDDTVRTWAALNHCPAEPTATERLDPADDGTHVVHQTFAAPKKTKGQGGAPVELYVVHGGGHTWPGRPAGLGWLGKSTDDVQANDVIWQFFEKHPLPAP